MHQAVDSMIVQLVLATGSKAGITAPIDRGYYMVGRHPECQIRPKTRSVSRRHLLIHHDQSAVHVIDLGSTSGTRINDEKIEPKRWHPIADGDVLRLGKTVFNVSIQSAGSTRRPRASNAPAPQSTRARANQPAGASSPRAVQAHQTHVMSACTTSTEAAASLVQGDAWQTFDVADFLHTADEVDRESRYESIRQSDAKRRADVVDDHVEEFDDDELADSPTHGDAGKFTAGVSSKAATASVAAKEATIVSATLSPNATRAAARRSEPVAQKKRWVLLPFSLRSVAGSGTAKLWLVVAMTVATLGYAGYAAVRFAQGPTIKIVEGID